MYQLKQFIFEIYNNSSYGRCDRRIINGIDITQIGSYYYKFIIGMTGDKHKHLKKPYYRCCYPIYWCKISTRYCFGDINILIGPEYASRHNINYYINYYINHVLYRYNY